MDENEQRLISFLVALDLFRLNWGFGTILPSPQSQKHGYQECSHVVKIDISRNQQSLSLKGFFGFFEHGDRINNNFIGKVRKENSSLPSL